GYPLKKSHTFTIADDDCDFNLDDFIGDASSVEIYPDGNYGPYDTNFALVDGTTLELDNFWDSGMVVQVTIDPDTRAVSVVENTWSQYGFTWSISGEGSINTCGKKMSINYTLTSPDYGVGYDETFPIDYSY